MARRDSSTRRSKRALPLAASRGRQRRGVLVRIWHAPVRPSDRGGPFRSRAHSPPTLDDEDLPFSSHPIGRRVREDATPTGRLPSWHPNQRYPSRPDRPPPAML